MAERRALVMDGCGLDVKGEGEIGTGGGADGVGCFYRGDVGVVVGEDRDGRVGPKFRLKANSGG